VSLSDNQSQRAGEEAVSKSPMKTYLGLDPFQFSTTLWIGGGVLGAVLSKQHRFAGAGLGAIMTGGFGDVLIERDQAGLPLAGAALGAIAIGALTLYAIHELRPPKPPTVASIGTHKLKVVADVHAR
jgi:hypothetical protein